MDTVQPLSARDIRRTAWFAYVGAAVALSGAQMISPALPVMQESLSLSTTQLGLVMSVYLFPAAVFSIPVGFLADRLGRRLVFGTAFIGFGVCGVLLPVVASSWLSLLGVRFLQGVMFAGLLPLSMTMLGDMFTGPALVAAHGKRSVAMSLADGMLPVLGGLIVAGGWFVPWLGQAVAIPFGLAVLANVADPPAVRRSAGAHRGLRELAAVFRRVPIIALQYMGFLRMFLKFTILTFLPLLVVGVRGLSPAFAGVVVGVAAGSGAVMALAVGRLARLGQPTSWVMVGVVFMGVGLMGLVISTSPLAMLASAALYGAADGLMGVFTNSFVTAATGAEIRASFVAFTGAVRNLAKFAAPVVAGALVAVQGLTDTFALLGAITIGSALLTLALRPLQGSIAARSEGDG